MQINALKPYKYKKTQIIKYTILIYNITNMCIMIIIRERRYKHVGVYK